MKRLLTLLLAVAMVLGVLALAACGGEPAETKPSSSETNPTGTSSSETSGTTASSETEKTETSSSETEETTESSSSGTGVIPEDPTLDGLSKHPDYMDVNFGGKEFSFIVNYGWSGGWDIYDICAELTGDDTILEEAIDKRNKTIESLYNCKITQQQSDTDGGKGAHGFIGDDIALGRCTFQFCMPLWQNLMVQNFYNIASLDVNLNNSWWDQDYINAMGVTIDGADYLYCISGQFNLLTYDSAIALLVNRTLYDQLLATGKIKEDIFAAAREGRWTMQMLYETMLEASTDVNGDSKLDFESGDVFGMVDDRNYNT
ncbi:MAG: hypothetical protein KBS76_01865, partial [Ruminococcus sp.]|nr:hypothetical protein [Candidatus Apopatosoma intestinale]